MSRTVMAYAMLALMAIGVAGNWIRRQWRTARLGAPLAVVPPTVAPIRPACACEASWTVVAPVPNTEDIWFGDLPAVTLAPEVREAGEHFDRWTRLASYGRAEVERDWPHVFSRE